MSLFFYFTKEKMKMLLFQLVILTLLILGNGISKGDTIITKEGESYSGKIISQDAEKIVLEMKIGIIKFQNEEVASIEKSPSDQFEEEMKVERPAKPDLFQGKTVIEKGTGESGAQHIYFQQPSEQSEKKMMELQNKEQELLRREEELKKREEAQKSETANKAATSEAQNEKNTDLKEGKKEPEPSISIKPTIRGLKQDQYKTY